MKKKLFFLYVFTFFSFDLNAYDSDFENKIKVKTAAFHHIEEDKATIEHCLQSLEEAHLNFFWATGFTPSDASEYNPVLKVEIGGALCGQKFFPYIKVLLQNSPNHLKINLVCDTLTSNAYRQEILNLQQEYKNRFMILPIEDIYQNVLQAFSQPAQQNRIHLLFKNAVAGAPVIASDVYRIMGMIDWRSSPEAIKKIQYTYCDIDAFCYGIETLKHQKLVTALFQPVKKSPFYFGKHPLNNDLIKINIEDVGAYKKFCENLLQKFDIPDAGNSTPYSQSVATHFLHLHEMIKQCENDEEYLSRIISIIPDPVQNLITKVVNLTGPMFLHYNNTHISTDLLYPTETLGTWDAAEVRLNYHESQYRIATPHYILNWRFPEVNTQQTEACEAFNQDCDEYKRILSAFLYAERFGENHPFNQKLKSFLLENYPYEKQSFKEMVKVNFHMHSQDKEKNYILRSVKNLSEQVEDIKEDVLYLEQEENYLKFKALSSEGKIIAGIFEINVGTELTYSSLIQNKEKILKMASEKGLKRPSKKGRSYEKWKKSVFTNFIESSYNYAILNKILKDIGIEIPFNPENIIDF